MELGKKIRVLVVDDSALARNLIIQGLSAHPRMEIVGYAINTLDAKQKIPRLKPDVVTMDVEMPGQSGIDFLKEYLPANPVPVILCSSLNLKVFDALNAGAVDFVRKPDVQESKEVFISNLTQKVLVASMARPRSAPLRSPSIAVATPNLGGGPALDRVLVGLGASTGGTEATLEVMRRLPADIPPMVIVQHMPKGFTQMYADRLNRICKMEVREAKNGDELHRGLALVAPADLQCRVVRIGEKYTVSCTPGEKVSGHRPSVDAMFHSMAEVVRCKMVGIIMTGMGQDGAAGLLEMRKKGAYTIGQDKESSVVYGMPMVANDIGAVCIQASCDNVANVLLRHLKTLH
ncbi:chemotaxis response regulator protein-glutamate methylesterase [Oscillibacter sp.]|jgi:two-component system chemotaxis response regulator CheB|uniref:protein-glutamate methylesterase/protein-glutamine glutaminase n=1 Tax=Oscillibacter sp. TaxID=1945593 RepID=UPI00216D89D6|nr:chemotaxis response regulator protein-glutamate methylesterase [Oscillibacter sp.]MCI9011071.1 chemotaxis response regulator protein-glutamate methylesterase [Oscillibacter sp.]MCI9113023.1 chemotaxis response regulator protein-glutamate methylesterase [Oscillibacter sp.]MCI9240657.1 chemotaxis response regulator protein-glutamate methylesterase [Oscillibacter sp.]